MENYSTLSRDRTFRKKSYGIIIFAVVAIVGLYAVIFTVQNYFSGSTPTGSAGSSYATIASGNKAWSELLSNNGHSVKQDRGAATIPKLDGVQSYGSNLTTLRLDRQTRTVVVLGGALPSNEAADVAKFIKNGGRLITDNPLLLNDVLGNRLIVSIQGATQLRPSSDHVSGMQDINEVEGSGAGSVVYKSHNDVQALLSSARASDSVLEDSSRKSSQERVANAAIFRVGGGDVIALVDTGIVSNEGLVRQDNALFSLRIAGSPGSSVTFIEGIHGFNDKSGFAGMPLAWRVGIIGLFVAFVIFSCAKGRRFGVGEEPNRDLGPRRIYFAHAVSQALKKSKG